MKHFYRFIFCVFCIACLSANAQVRKNFIERTVDWGYRIIEGDSAHPRKRTIFIFPIIAYKPESRWIGGASVTQIFRVSKDSITRPSVARFDLSYSQERQFSFRPVIDIFSKLNKLNVRAIYNYTNFGEFYYGIGRNALASNEEAYKFNMHDLNVKAAYQFVPKLYLGIQYNFEQMYNIDANPNGLLKNSNVPGNNGYKASGFGLTLYYDDRDRVYFPLRGQMIEISNIYHEKFFGSKFEFINVTLDARKYIHLWKENVLALQSVFNMNDGDIPFRMQGVLGNFMIMRGYYNGRYRDKHSAAFQAELRKTIWGPVGMVAFVGCGTVANNKWDLATRLLPNYGIGLRVKAIRKEHVNVRIDYGIGNKENRAVYISLYEAF